MLIEQVFYNMGFKDAENSAGLLIFQSRKLKFMEGYMVAVNAISLLDTSPFKDVNQIPLPNDPPEDTQADDQLKDAKYEREDSLGIRELSEQIDAHVVVIDEENPNNAAPIETQSAPPSIPCSDPLTTTTAPKTSTAAPRDPFA